MPLAHDQFDNAARVKRLGVGDYIVPSRFRGPRVAAKLDALIGSNTVRDACREVSGRMWGRDGVKAAADAIERAIGKGWTASFLDGKPAGLIRGVAYCADAGMTVGHCISQHGMLDELALSPVLASNATANCFPMIVATHNLPRTCELCSHIALARKRKPAPQLLKCPPSVHPGRKGGPFFGLRTAKGITVRCTLSPMGRGQGEGCENPPVIPFAVLSA